MKRFPKKFAGLALSSCFFFAPGGGAESYSGKVTDLSGFPLSGAGILLSIAGHRTGTAPDGTWSLSMGTTGLLVRPTGNTIFVAKHLLLDGNRLRLQLGGVDVAGRPSNAAAFQIHESPPRTADRGVAARSAATVDDTLLISWNGRVRTRVPLAQIAPSDTQRIDTATTSTDIPWNGGIAYGSFTDPRDNQVYRTVTIGTQRWFAQNLNYDPGGIWCLWSADCGAKYGSLYGLPNGSIVPDSFIMCPGGWHLPSDSEWTTLTTFVGGDSTAGRVLKSTSGWDDSGNGTDAYGFRALPAGDAYGGTFGGIGNDTYWLTEPEGGYRAWLRRLRSANANMIREFWGHMGVFSVRCLQD